MDHRFTCKKNRNPPESIMICFSEVEWGREREEMLWSIS